MLDLHLRNIWPQRVFDPEIGQTVLERLQDSQVKRKNPNLPQQVTACISLSISRTYPGVNAHFMDKVTEEHLRSLLPDLGILSERLLLDRGLLCEPAL